MGVFRFDSNDQYILPANVAEGKSVDVHVMTLREKSTDGSRWVARVGPSTKADFNALEVWGVTIEGDEQFKELAADLAFKSTLTSSRSYRLGVTRFGLCFVRGSTTGHRLPYTVSINDYFGWSKYGVKPPLPPEHYRVGSATVFNICDLSSGDTKVVDVRGAMRAAEEVKKLRQRLEEMEEEAEEVRVELAACKKELECVDEAMGRSEKSKFVWDKLAGEKEKEVKELRNQLFAFKIAMVSLLVDR